MDKKRTTKEKKIRYFHEEQAKEEELLNIGLKESRRAIANYFIDQNSYTI